MRIRMLFPAIALVAASALPAVALGAKPMSISGSGDVASKSFTPGSFDTISMHGIPGFRIVGGDTPSVMLKTDSNIASRVSVRTVGSRLEVSLDPGYSYKPTSFELDITVPRIAAAAFYDSRGSIDKLSTDAVELDLYGRSAVDVAELDAESVALNVAERSNLTGSVNAYKASLGLHGLAQASISGSTDQVSLTAQGGRADLSKLAANRAYISLSGANASINADHGTIVTGIVHGGANLTYIGSKPDIGGLAVNDDSSVSWVKG